MPKKQLTMIILFALAVTIVFFIFFYFRYIKTDAQTSKPHSEELGTLTILSDNDVIGAAEEEADGQTDYVETVNFINYDAVSNLFTIAAFENLFTETRAYLDEHGYADAFNLTIDISSVSGGRAAPYFECSLDTAEKTLSVHYDISTMTFSFSFLD